MNSQHLYRAARKLVRPLKRRLQPKRAIASLEELNAPALVLIAHPDDEVFCSGLICELLSREQEVHLVCFTRGEGGERGEVSPDAQLSKIRENELAAAAKSLAITSLTFLDYVDPASQNGRLSEPDYDSPELLTELENLIENQSISHLITHGSSGEYWHPAHLCLHRHARLLNRRLPRLQLWTFNSWAPNHKLPAVLNQDDPTDLTLNASAHHKVRLESLTCHHSQKDVFQRFANGSLADFITLTATENYRKW